jgi:hypothetical protein
VAGFALKCGLPSISILASKLQHSPVFLGTYPLIGPPDQ